MKQLLFIFFLGLAANTIAFEKDDLRSGEWEFKNQKDTEWLPAKNLDVHLDLIDNGIIEHPYYGDNEERIQWIENENWEYRTTFFVDSVQFTQQNLELVFEGVDTYAQIHLNGKLIVDANNMFRTWKANVKDIISYGENELTVIFYSPIQRNKERVINAAYQLPSANETVDLKVYPYVRKAAYQFGWDWGPRIVTFGFWNPIKLKGWDNFRVINTTVHTHKIMDSVAFLSVEFYIENNYNSPVMFTAEFMGIGHKFLLKDSVQRVHFPLKLESPNLWNPIGYGSPNLYKENLIVKDIEANLMSEQEITFGVRTVELVQDKDSIGASFYFKVNGQSIYAKGANYIPQSMFLNEVEESDYVEIIDEAVDLNMNMLRVWGGGVYERDKFYELCDEKGILVWQDFMFANSMYPNDVDFIENVKLEVSGQIKRLRVHPSVVLWCGNNEMQVAWENWGWQTQFGYTEKQEAEIYSNYEQVFQTLIPKQFKILVPGVEYVSTTPLSNWGTPENFNHLSMHYWGVWHGKESIENYKNNVGRFMVEYGFQSFPDDKFLAKYVGDDQMHLDSSGIVNRQKSYIGNGMIDDNIRLFNNEELSFKEWIVYSQLVQAHALGVAIRAHRTQTPHCMGTLFWQFNDCWPGPSWSIRDYEGNHKLAYDEVKKYYQPIIGTMEQEEDSIIVKLVSDKINDQEIQVYFQYYESGAMDLVTHSWLDTLSFLTPKEYEFDLPNKRKQGYYILTIFQADEVLFKDEFFPRENTTIRQLTDFKE